jgi:hypothetical protein
MKRSLGPTRTPVPLPEPFRTQLNMYALAAAAEGTGIGKALPGYGAVITVAGLGMLVGVMPAEGKIVYTPTHKSFGGNNATLNIDLNHDGVRDFVLRGYSFRSTLNFGRELVVSGMSQTGYQNAVWGQPSNASALRAGVHVGAGRFPVGGRHMATILFQSDRGPYFLGPWANSGKGVKNHYLGFKFRIHGKVHYGWARITVEVSPVMKGTLTGYAYETIPNKPIVTGRTKDSEEISSVEQSNPALTSPALGTASLGLLAMGSPGLSLWRREYSDNTAGNLPLNVPGGPEQLTQ